MSLNKVNKFSSYQTRNYHVTRSLSKDKKSNNNDNLSDLNGGANIYNSLGIKPVIIYDNADTDKSKIFTDNKGRDILMDS